MEDFEYFFNNFSRFIKYQILKYNPFKEGIDPEDIIQDVRIKLWKLFCSEKNISNYPSYIKKIVNSSVIDQLRKLRREENILNYEKNKYIAENECWYPNNSYGSNSIEEIVGKAVETLKESRRQVVKLYLLNLNILEISSYLNWTTAKTRNLLYRGLSDLRKTIRKMDIPT